MMVMKRSSDSETHVKSKRIRSRVELEDNGLRERLSSPESARDSGSPRRTSSLSRKQSDERTYKRSSNANMRNDNNYQIQQRRTERDPEPQIRLSNLANHVGDQPMKESIFHEFKKFGEVSVHLFGRGNDRYAVVYFRSLEDAKETKRVLERRNRLVLFDRPARTEYNLYPERTTSRSHSPGENYSYNRRSASPVRWKRGTNPTNSFEFDRGRGDYDRRNRGGDNFTPPQREYIPPEEDPKATRTLFVGNLETSVSSQDLRRSFEKFGVVLDVDIKRPARGQGNTYAFVKFADLDVAAKSKISMQGEFIGRNRIKIGYGRSQQTTRLWVGGLGPWISIPELEREFDRFGAIRRIDYRKGEDHAYILYDSLDAASVAAREMRGFQMGDRRLRIDFADKDQGVKEYDSFYDERRASSPSRGRANDVERMDNMYSPPKQDRDFRDERIYLEPKGGDPPFRRDRSDDNVSYSRNWRNDDSFQTGSYDRRESNQSQRSYGVNNWNRQNPKVEMDESNDWERRSQDKPIRGPQYRRKGPQTPPIEDFPPYERSPEKNVDANVPRKRRGQSYRTRDFQSDDDAKPPKTSRTRSPSPNNTNRARLISPHVRRHSGSSSDSHFSRSHTGSTNAFEEDEKSKNAEDRDTDKKAKKDKDKKSNEGKSKESTPAKENPTASSPGTENLQDLAKRFAVAWKGSLILKNSAFPVRMHLVGGNPEIADSLLRNDGSAKSALRITQRLRLDQPKLEEVSRRINTAGASGHCLLLALPGAQTPLPESSEELQHRALRNLMTYLKQKQAAGVVNLPVSSNSLANAKDEVGVLHAFPPCQFSHEHLLRIAPHLSPEPSKEDHLVIVVVRGAA